MSSPTGQLTWDSSTERVDLSVLIVYMYRIVSADKARDRGLPSQTRKNLVQVSFRVDNRRLREIHIRTNELGYSHQ